MKRTISMFVMLITLVMSSCDLLYTESEEKLSGSEFWDDASSSDVSSFVNSMYSSLRSATMQDAAMFLFAGDLRCAPISTKLNTGRSEGRYVLALSTNDLNLLRETYSSDNDYRADAIMRWQGYYEVVQSANILLNEISRTGISASEQEAFRYEAIFARCLAYFLMVRNFGDVPYYTNAYNSASLPRTDMMTVLQNISEDLQQILDSDPDGDILPMTRSGSDRAIKASRGAVLALLMHISMWQAGFAESNQATYYNKVVECGQQLVDNNGGAYSLVPLSQMTNNLFSGGSVEGIFEIVQNITYVEGGETFNNEAIFANHVMYKALSSSRSKVFYTYDFMSKVYPVGISDGRVELWFDDNAYSTMEDNPREILKFSNVDTYKNTSGSEVTTCNSGNFILFRLADAILLYAEALAELGTDDVKACQLLNMVRTRAEAEEINASGTDLKDAIYWERVRELIGEGQYFYDLVRTKKLCDGNYCWHTVTRANFNKGAWTWPISQSALDNNTQMELNTYWE